MSKEKLAAKVEFLSSLCNGMAYIDVDKAAQLAGVHPNTIRKAIRTKKLASTRIGTAIRIGLDDFAAWLLFQTDPTEQKLGYEQLDSSIIWPRRDTFDFFIGDPSKYSTPYISGHATLIPTPNDEDFFYFLHPNRAQLCREIPIPVFQAGKWVISEIQCFMAPSKPKQITPEQLNSYAKAMSQLLASYIYFNQLTKNNESEQIAYVPTASIITEDISEVEGDYVSAKWESTNAKKLPWEPTSIIVEPNKQYTCALSGPKGAEKKSRRFESLDRLYKDSTAACTLSLLWSCVKKG